MSTSGTAGDDLINRGFIRLNPGTDAAGRTGRTLIVTGLQRSGTSLVAAVLRQVGIFMGAEINDSVHEDEAVARLLAARDKDGLRRLIHERNASYGTWGFKYPNLGNALEPADMALFTNPHVIVPFRDLVSIAMRKSISDYDEPMPALRSAADAMINLVSFIDRMDCPVLLLSYEKALILPGDFIDALLRFCDLPQSEMLRKRLIELIEPNRKDYREVARRRFEGVVDGVGDGALYGWCRLTGSAEPVTLDLFADDRHVLRFVADIFRQDLLEAGMATGRHGFHIDLHGRDLPADAVIRVRVADRGIELQNSGRRLAQYRA